MGTLADKLAYLNATKEAIKTALQNKGITVLATDTFRSYAQKIANIVTPSHTTLGITPSTSSQSHTPSYPYNGYSQVNVSAVDSSIDANIQAGNIKDGVSILGVTGNYTGGGGGASLSGCNIFVVSNGVLSRPTNNNLVTIKTSSDVTNIAPFAFQTFSNDVGLFIASNIAAVDFSSLTTITGNFAFEGAFTDCENMTSANFSNLISVTAVGAFEGAFEHCSSLTNVDFSSLTTIKHDTFNNTFQSCTSLTTLSFPSLTLAGIGNYGSQFDYMLQGVTGCTVHFPSNLQSRMSNWDSIVNGFGGTNTTVLFDLPATT